VFVNVQQGRVNKVYYCGGFPLEAAQIPRTEAPFSFWQGSTQRSDFQGTVSSVFIARDLELPKKREAVATLIRTGIEPFSASVDPKHVVLWIDSLGKDRSSYRRPLVRR
jgi:hypothetical protein